MTEDDSTQEYQVLGSGVLSEPKGQHKYVAFVRWRLLSSDTWSEVRPVSATQIARQKTTPLTSTESTEAKGMCHVVFFVL